MAAGEEEQKKGQGKGFAGLSSLVSEVDTTLPPPAKQDAGGTGASSRAERATASQNAQTRPQPAQPQPYQAPSQPSAGSSTGKWVLGIVAVIGVIWLLGQSNKSPDSSSTRLSFGCTKHSDATYSPPPATPQAPSRPEETRAARRAEPRVFDSADSVLPGRRHPHGCRKVRSSIATATLMWIGSMPWWLTTTAVAGVSAIEAALWKVRAAT